MNAGSKPLVEETETSTVERQLDHLREPVIRKNLRLRHTVKQAAGCYLAEAGFLEVDTPVLGPRVNEYPAGHIAAKMKDGTELWLTQSPQVLKQMLIAAGYGRYFQFAHCFRDEQRPPGRFDYLREFVQLDLEMEATDAFYVRRTIEDLVGAILHPLGVEAGAPFVEIDAVECVRRYGTDRPDLRTSEDELAFVWVTNFPLLEEGADGAPVLARHPMALPTTVPGTIEEAHTTRTHSYDLVLNGYEIASGDLRIHDAQVQRQILELIGAGHGSLDDLLVVLRDCPPHGGAGLGLDRLVMRLAGSASVADATAFPDLSGF